MNYKILSKFIKDISFEIPNAQTFVMLEKELPKYNLLFDIKSKPFKEKIVEVNTILKILPPTEIKNKMLAEINLTALISIENPSLDKQALEKIILVEVPKEVYPTLYEVFVYLFNKAGVKNITIAKEVDFQKMYNEKTKS